MPDPDPIAPGGEPEPVSEKTFEIVEDSLVDLWSVVNDLARIRPPQPEFFRVSIFGSSRISEGDETYEQVKELARRLAERGCDIVTGGGPGVMKAANEGEQLGDPENETRSFGLTVRLPHEEQANPFVEKVYRHRTFFTRLHQFVRLSSAFVVMPGGIGTSLELLMIWQLLQVRHITDHPLILVGDMWHDLVDWADRYMLSHDPPLAGEEDVAIPTCVKDLDEAVVEVEKAREAFEAST